MNEFSFILLITSFIAGILTVFAPCIFTFLPIILGATDIDRKTGIRKATTIIAALGISVLIFSMLLRASTLLIQIPASTWEIVAGLIIITQGLIIFMPSIWEYISEKLHLYRTNNILSKINKLPNNRFNDILIGAALGPIFSSCSPTYGFIIGALLQSTFSISLIYLIVYILGLCLLLFAIAVLGQKLVMKLKWGLNPNGAFKRIAAVIFISVGLMIMTGFYKQLEAFIITNLPFIDVTRIDRMILENSVNNWM